MTDEINVDIDGDEVEIAFPSHPGELLRSWIEGHGETVAGTARRLGVSRTTLNRVLAGQRRMVPEMAVTLEEMGWSEADFWMGMQAQWEIARVRRIKREAD